jgi:hypothetical protein
VVDEPTGSTNLSGTNSDSRRLALERAARRGLAHGWAKQSPRRLHDVVSSIEAGVLRIWRREVVDEPTGSTNLSGTNSDSRRLALEREARKGEAQGWAEQSRADFTLAGTPSKWHFCESGREK